MTSSITKLRNQCGWQRVDLLAVRHCQGAVTRLGRSVRGEKARSWNNAARKFWQSAIKRKFRLK